MRLALLLSTLLAALPLEAETLRATPLPRLAQRLADELLLSAAGRALQLDPIENRSDSPTAALDLLTLLQARLEERASLQREGARLRVEALLTRAGGHLVVSARLIEEPGGRLVDIVSASVEADAALLTASPGAAQSDAPIEIRARTRSTPIEGPVLDLLFVDEERLLALTPDAVQLFRWNGQELTRDSRQTLPGPLAPVRHPGGLLLPAPGEGAVWALTSGAAQAALYEVQGARLLERARAAALPWKDAPQGLAYRPGTDWLEGPLPGLGAGPFLALEPGLRDVALSVSAELLVAGAEGPRATGLHAGPALVPLFDSFLVALSAEPPQARDRLLLFERTGEGLRAGPQLALELEGACTALGSLARREGARLAVAVQEPAGGTHLELLDLARAAAEEP